MRLAPIALLAALPLLALTACGGEPDTTDPMDLPTVGEDSTQTGVTDGELATNTTLSALGVEARKLATETPYEEDTEVVTQMRTILADSGGALPDELQTAVREDLTAITDAIAAQDKPAMEAAAKALIERLRIAAPAGGGRAPDVAS